MIKFIFTIIIISLLGCNGIRDNSKLILFYNPKNPNLSYSGIYLSANYSISKGDAYTASTLLNAKKNKSELLQLKFISNLVSGNFEYANKIFKKLDASYKNKPLYNLPKFLVSLNNNDLNSSLEISKTIKNFLNFDNITPLIKFWLLQQKNKDKKTLNFISKETSVHKLLILENFYNKENLKEIAEYNFELKSLSNIDLLLLAGYYYRINDKSKFDIIIKDKVSNQFDKEFIINKFSSPKNIFNKVPTIQMILASKIYDNVSLNNLDNKISYSYLKILLEMVLYLCPDMDIAKYTLAELYNKEKSYHASIKKLNTISSQSFLYLASNLKKISITKLLKLDDEYQTLLSETKKIWPNNIFVMLRLADHQNSLKNYYKAMTIYKNIIKEHGDSDSVLFLYASSLDKIGKWDEARKVLKKLLINDPENTYALNYLSYTLTLKNKELDLALNLIKRALLLDPNNGFFLDTLGWVEYKRYNFESSVFYLEKSAVILPRSPEVIDHLGDCYLMLGRKNEAVYEWKKALKYETNISAIKLLKEKIINHE